MLKAEMVRGKVDEGAGVEQQWKKNKSNWKGTMTIIASDDDPSWDGSE